MPSILFVCTANQFRSPIATACLLKNIEKDHIEGEWIVQSAGTWTSDGHRAPEIALKVASQLGLDGLDNHRSRQINQKLLKDFDLIIVMEIGQKEAICSEFPFVCGRVYTLSEIVDGIAYDISDPAYFGISSSRVGHELFMLITKGKEKILQLAETLCKSKSQEHGNS
jgi:protein-tyrosine phosphatase